MDLDRVAVKIVNLTDEQLISVTRITMDELTITPRWYWRRIREMKILLMFLDVEMGRRLRK